jgi:hypothetical protein
MSMRFERCTKSERADLAEVASQSRTLPGGFSRSLSALRMGREQGDDQPH